MSAQLNASIADIPLPRRMRSLPISSTGFPIPWFVIKKADGEYDIRVADGSKIVRAVRQKLCWVCGNTLGRHLAFVIGPMCAVNRVTSEPPCHRDCAEYAIVACPFLTKPKMRRNEKELPADHTKPAGVMLDRNPGAVVLWITGTYTPFRPDPKQPGYLFKLGKPEQVMFFREGRAATREEVMESIDSGMPFLRQMAHEDGPKAIDQLEFQYREAVRLLPAA